VRQRRTRCRLARCGVLLLLLRVCAARGGVRAAGSAVCVGLFSCAP
jgi:hypothetical protein